MSPVDTSNDRAAGDDIPLLTTGVWLLPSSSDRTIRAWGPSNDQYRYLQVNIHI